VTLIDDYAHHPTEIEASITACRTVYAGRPLVAAFQPHLFSRTRDFAQDFGRALALADEVWVTDVYPAREKPIEGVNGALVARAAEQAGVPVHYAENLHALEDSLLDGLRPGDVCLVMGAGDIDRVARTVLGRLYTRESR
jgi:UDP-N-acetylmuramate--alanine ligase